MSQFWGKTCLLFWYYVHKKNCLANYVHEQLVSLCKRLEIIYIDNRNIREIHLFKDGLHLLDSGKRILANNFIFNLNNFLCQIQRPVLLT